MESSDIQSVSEDRSSIKVESKINSFSPSARERTAMSPAIATRERAAVSPTSDERKVVGKAGIRSGSQISSPDRTPPGSRPASPGQGTFAGA